MHHLESPLISFIVLWGFARKSNQKFTLPQQQEKGIHLPLVHRPHTFVLVVLEKVHIMKGKSLNQALPFPCLQKTSQLDPLMTYQKTVVISKHQAEWDIL